MNDAPEQTPEASARRPSQPGLGPVPDSARNQPLLQTRRQRRLQIEDEQIPERSQQLAATQLAATQAIAPDTPAPQPAVSAEPRPTQPRSDQPGPQTAAPAPPLSEPAQPEPVRSAPPQAPLSDPLESVRRIPQPTAQHVAQSVAASAPPEAPMAQISQPAHAALRPSPNLDARTAQSQRSPTPQPTSQQPGIAQQRPVPPISPGEAHVADPYTLATEALMLGPQPQQQTDFGTVELVQEAIGRIEEARALPMGGSAMINRDDILSLLDAALDALPAELQQARMVVRERDEVLEQARKNAAMLIEEARARVAQRVQQTEVVRAAERRARQLVDDAETQARRRKHEIDDYCERCLDKFYDQLRQVLERVNVARRKLAPGAQASDIPQAEMSQTGVTPDALVQAQPTDFQTGHPQAGANPRPPGLGQPYPDAALPDTAAMSSASATRPLLFDQEKV